MSNLKKRDNPQTNMCIFSKVEYIGISWYDVVVRVYAFLILYGKYEMHPL